MAENAYICLNGDYLRNNTPTLFPNNRAFRYGDSLHENMYAYATRPQFLNYHLQRLFGNMQQLCMPVPANFTGPNFTELLERLLNKNRIFAGAAIRLTVFREGEDHPFPQDGRVAFLLETRKLEGHHYTLNEKGLSADICQDYVKQTGPLTHLYNAHAMLYLLAGMDARKRGQDTLILLNEKARMVETFNANVFLVSGNALFTPGIQQGCIPGVMRRIIIGLAGEAGFTVNDQCNFTAAALDDAEEVFLTNAVEGIRWVGAYRQRRYYNKAAKLLIARLNDLAFHI